MAVKNYLLTNLDTSKVPSQGFGRNLLIESLGKAYSKGSTDEERKKNLEREYELRKDELNDKLKTFIEIIESAIENIEEGKILSIKYKGYSPKSSSFYNLFLRLPNLDNDIFEFRTIRISHDDKKIFDFFIKNKELAIGRLDDILQILKMDDLLVSKKVTKNNISFFEKLNPKTITRKDKSIIEDIIYIEKIETIEIIDYSEVFRFSPMEFESLSIKGKENIEKDIDINLNETSTYKVGVLDEKIHKDFLNDFNGLVEYQNLLTDEDDFLDFTEDSHAESVASIVMFGDKLNGVYDGNGVIKTKIFSVLSKDNRKNRFNDVVKRIQTAVHNNEDIKIFVLSMGLAKLEQQTNQITPFGVILDEIAIKYNIRFITTGGNDDFRGLDLPITPPSDSELAITVNALDDIEGEPASYSRLGYYGIFGNKPTLSFFGGDSNKRKINVYESGGIKKVEGTSLAAPWVARYYSNIYFSNINSSLPKSAFLNKYKHEYTEAILINDSMVNTEISYFNNILEKKDKNLLGAGKLPINKFESDAIRYIAIFDSDMFEDKKLGRYNYIEKMIPLPKIKDNYDYSVSITIVDIPFIDHKFGADYIHTTTAPKRTMINGEGKTLNPTKNKSVVEKAFMVPFASNETLKYLRERELVKKGKWRRLYAEKIYINDYKKDIENENELSIKLNLEKTYRYDSKEPDEDFCSTGNDIKSIIVYEYELGENIDISEFNEELEKIHNEFRNDLHSIELPDLEVPDI